jgi:hypothetical protein
MNNYEIIENKIFKDERDLFGITNKIVKNCTFESGESPLKEASNIEVINSTFSYKYPLWYTTNVNIFNTTFNEMARSGLWYTRDIKVDNSKFHCPKSLRRSNKIIIENSSFLDATEMLWECTNIEINNSDFNGDYILKNSKNIVLHNVKVKGNYFCDGAGTIKAYDSIFESKDAFWNSKNVKIVRCKLIGEYLAWNSKNITIEDSYIESHQGLCYIKKLVIINSNIVDSDLIFEYSFVKANFINKNVSIKNPYTSIIETNKLSEILLDSRYINIKKVRIIENEV